MKLWLLVRSSSYVFTINPKLLNHEEIEEMPMELETSGGGAAPLIRDEYGDRRTKFRDALRHEDRLVWDEMLKAVGIRRDAINTMDRDEFEKQVTAMMIGQRKIDDEVEEKVDCLRKKHTAFEGTIRSDL